MVASDWSKPEPDLAIVRGDVEDYSDRDVTAADIALVVEISAATLIDDRTAMAQRLCNERNRVLLDRQPG